MKNQGYFIARNRKSDEFFTSSSAYDRPQWKTAATATRYLDVQLAESAMKKLLNNGYYEARLVPVSEAMSFEMPDDNKEVTLPSDEERQDLEANGGDPDDLSVEPPADAEQMVSDEDMDDEDDTSDIQAQVDAKLGNKPTVDVSPEDELGDDQLLNPDDAEGGMDGDVDGDQDVDQETADLAAALDADASNGDMDQESDLPPEDELRGEPVIKEDIVGMKTIPVMQFKGDTTDQSAGKTGPMDHQDKVKVPADVKSDLRKVIADFKKQAEFSNSRDDARATFCMTVVAAMEELQELLATGTVESIKMAQIKVTSWMNPITVNLPVSVQKFIYMGGRKPTLKDLFDSKRAEKKAK